MKKVTTYVVGDIVKLKSGGPNMTIKDIVTGITYEPDNSYNCQWFAGKKLDRGVFPHDSLIKVEDES